MATVKELAEELGVSPQTVRRYVKDVMGVATQPRKTLQLDANQASLVAAHFSGKTMTSATESATPVATEVADLLQDVATLRERVAGLERENELLKERLEIADAALEREQMQARGFWSRLGQKLLGG
ncbi:MAG: HTH domain-containing protein [Gordonibacter pamelaeae]|uniref:HTH domain-containing protein n=1 Tax=Gordonibacter pamelaeae TaxID=471189 RepID=UPI00242B97FB|nr:HTH domain-containing protein [Gordonibacter pamelaeae]MBS4897348.1 HTH domain-containing protein [Gordonibacter pamelaeae]